jgi:hypothetical protein
LDSADQNQADWKRWRVTLIAQSAVIQHNHAFQNAFLGRELVQRSSNSKFDHIWCTFLPFMIIPFRERILNKLLLWENRAIYGDIESTGEHVYV